MLNVLSHGEYLRKLKKSDAVLITSDKSYFPDDIQGQCASCAKTIYYRPYNKAASKKICLKCAPEVIHG